MPNVLCEVCKSEFYTKPSQQKKGWGRFCSKKCQYLAQTTGQTKSCTTCGKEIYRTKSLLERSQSNLFFCCKSCQTIWRNKQYTRENHANWVSGIYSYRAALLRENRPLECIKCKSKDSRILAVHHKDKNRHNNSPDNLAWLCHNCNYLVHHYPNEAVGFISNPNNSN